MAPKITRRRFVTRSVKLAVVSPLLAVHPAATQAAAFTAAARRTLRAAVDVIVPADERMPAASAIGAPRYIERIAGGDETLRKLLLDGLRDLDAFARSQSVATPSFAALSLEQQVAALTHLEKTPATQPSFAALRDLVYEAYYTHPRVWKLVGYTFRSGRRPTARLEAFDEQLLARVRKLPPFYRQVP